MKPIFVIHRNWLLPIILALLFSLWGCRDHTGNDSPTTSDKQKEVALDELFTALKQTEDAYETQVLQARIWEIWMDCDEQGIQQLMTQGVNAMSTGEYDKATESFTQIIKKSPDYAEAWNKRATSLYMMGDLKASLEDIEKTLVLEERHFGALSGLAAIYMMEGEEREALKTYERIARIAPAEPHIQEQIQYLRNKMGITLI